MNSLFSRTSRGQDGQVLALFALLLACLMGVAALAIDIGFVVHAQRELQASADAAATAGALDLSDNLSASAAVATANTYSAIAGGKNAYADLPNVTMVSGYPVAKCLTSTGLCSSCPCGNASGDNALAVAEQVTVPTFFAKLFGFKSITLTAQSLSSMKGGAAVPYNILLVVDTTASMGNNDNACKADTGIQKPTRLDCAKYGVRTLLNQLSPCAINLSSCGAATGGNVANPVQEVGLLVFPGLTSSTYASYDYSNCQANSISKYIAPYSTSTVYTIVPLSSDYKTSYTSGLSGSSSALVQAVDWSDGAGCKVSAYGLQDPGGEGTYYAGTITAAQAMFSALPSSRSSVQNAIILLSDGDANANSGTQISTSLATNQCHQAITAAQTAARAGTWVYTIAYGASNGSGSGCSTDSPAITPCQTLAQMASSSTAIPDASKFYSDHANGCASSAHPSITDLGQIFTQISYDFLSTRLLPWNTQ